MAKKKKKKKNNNQNKKNNNQSIHGFYRIGALILVIAICVSLVAMYAYL